MTYLSWDPTALVALICDSPLLSQLSKLALDQLGLADFGLLQLASSPA